MKILFQRLTDKIEKNPGDWFAILLLSSWHLVYFWQAALRQVVFYFGDIYFFFYPVRLAYANAMREGRLPLWAPEMMGGYPLFAEGQVAALYPLNFLLYLLLPIDLATNYAILLHLTWVGLGTYFFLRALKLHPASALFGALAFAGGGFFYARLVHMTVLAAAAWMPWLFWAWEKFEQARTRARRWRWFALLCALSAIQLFAGHPQFALFSALLIGAYSIVRWKRENKESETTGQFAPARILPAMLCFAIGALIAGAQLVPTLELTTLSNRATGLLPKFFNAYSLRLPHYLMLFHPFLAGNPFPLVSVETIGYVGLLPILGALVAPLVVRERRVFFFLFVALFSLWMAQGDQNVFYRGMRYLPILNLFRVPARFFFPYSFSVAILAAITLDYFIRRAPAASVLTRAQIVALAGLALLVAFVIGILPWTPLSVLLSLWTGLPLALFFVAAWIGLGARRALWTRNMLIILAIGMTLVDLALFAGVYAKTYDTATPVEDFYSAPQSIAALKGVSRQEGRLLVDPWIEPWLAVMRESFFPNTFILHGLASARGYTPLLLQRNEDYIESMTPAMLNLMNVRYFLKPQMLPVDAVTEGNDLRNEFGLDLVGYGVTFPATIAARMRVHSSMAQSVGFATGHVVANINLLLEDGSRREIPLRAGFETAEWAYERSDVRAQAKHALPPIATTFPASSAFPVEKHAGHTFLGEWDITREGKPLAVSGVSITPLVERGLLHVERVEFVTPEGKTLSLAHLIGKTDQTLVYRTNEVAIYENADRLPRAFLVHRAIVERSDAETLKRMRRADFDARGLMLLADGEPLDTGGAQSPSEAVAIVEYKSERVVLDVRASAEGYVLLADSWYPGWVARVDGIETPIHRADYIYRAIRVLPGAHRVEFDYRPMSLVMGAGVSGVGVILLVGIAWMSTRFGRLLAFSKPDV